MTGEQDAAEPDQPAHDLLVDPRAIRVSLAGPSIHADVMPIVIEPAAVPLAPSRDGPGSLDALDDPGDRTQSDRRSGRGRPRATTSS